MSQSSIFDQILSGYEGLKKLQLAKVENKEILQQLTAIKQNVIALNESGQQIPTEPRELLAEMRHALPPLFAHHEYESEVATCQKLLSKKKLDTQDLLAMPYAGAYQALVSSELGLAKGTPITSVTHLGCGPLPMTLLFCALSRPRWHFTGVDINPHACEMAEALTRKLGLNGHVIIVNSVAENASHSNGSLPMIASLLEDKEAVYEKLTQSAANSFIVRDVVGTGTLVYKPSAVPSHGWRLEASTPPAPQRLNISKFYRRYVG